MKNIAVITVILFSCFACEKTDREATPSIVEKSSSGPVRYRDSLFQSYVTDSLQKIFYRQINNYNETTILALSAYLPKDDTASSRAATIFIHGGGFGKTAMINGMTVEPRKQ